jgi:hypothetical protein
MKDAAQYRPMTAQEMHDAIFMAIILQARHMPHLKGVGAIKDAERRQSAIHIFARAVTDQLILSNSVLMKGPPLEPHSISDKVLKLPFGDW